MWRYASRLSRFALMIMLLSGSATQLMAQQRYYYSMILRGGSYQPNIIYSVNTATGQIEPYSRRLSNALSGHPGVEVEAYSNGLDGTDYIDHHGLLLSSLQKLDPLERHNVGVLNSAVFWEPRSELHSDIFGVPHVESVNPMYPTINIKVVEENSASLPRLSNQYLPLPSFGLAGSVTGLPLSSPPPDLVGFDYHLAPRREAIYFTVNQSFSIAGPVTFRPSDILYLDTNDNIQIWQGASDLKVHQNDRIDGLSLCLHPATGLFPNCLLSLDNGCQTVVGNTTIMGADILLYVKDDPSVPKLRIWRDAKSNGLQIYTYLSAPDIDGVVSIDPKRFIPGSAFGYSTASPPLTLDEVYYNPSLNQLYIASTHWEWTQVKPTVIIEWNFSLTPLGSNGIFVPNPALKPGDERLVVIHYVYNGEPKSHYKVIRRAPTLTSASASIGDFGAQLFSTQVFCQLGSVIGLSWFDKWETTVDLATSLVANTVTQFLVPLPLGPPERKRVEVRALDSVSGLRGNAVGDVIWPSPALPPPSGLTIEKLDNSHVRIDWTPVPGTTTDLVVTGVPSSNTAPPVPLPVPPVPLPVATVTPPQTVFVGEVAGFRGVKLTAVSQDGLKSLPLEGSFFNGIDQRLQPNRTIPASALFPFQPGDLALEDSTATLVMVPRNPGPVFWTSYTLERNSALPELHTMSLPVNLHGVSSFLESVDPTGLPEVRNHLLFSALLSGNPKLIVTAAEAPYNVERVVDVVFPTPPSTIGPIAVETESDQILLVADGKLHSVDAAQSIMQVGLVTATPIDALRAATVDAVSCRGTGFYEISANDGSVAALHTHFLTLTSDHQVVSCMKLDSPLVAHGIVHAHDPLPTTYLSSASTIEVFQMPKIVEPVESNPFNRLGRPYDLNNDGVALDAADMNFFVAFVPLWYSDPVAAVQALEQFVDPAAWDVDGGSLTFPGDGSITETDLLAIFGAFQNSLAPSSSCVPVHPAWSPSPNSTCF